MRSTWDGDTVLREIFSTLHSNIHLEPWVTNNSIYQTCLCLWMFFVPPLSRFLSHFSLPTLYPVFVAIVLQLALSVRCGYILYAVLGKKDHLLHQFYYRVYYRVKGLTCAVYDEKVRGAIIGLWWGDKEYTDCRAGPGLWKTLHTDPPCEKFSVPRTRCVRLGGNNSPGPLTSSFGLLQFYDPLLCHTAAVSAASLCCDWTRRELEGRGWRGKRRGSSWDEVGSWSDMGMGHVFYFFIMAITDD